MHARGRDEFSWIIGNGPDEKALEYVKHSPTLITKKDWSACTPLHYAAEFGMTNTVRWLIKQKADVNAVAYNGFTPMHLVTNGVIAGVLIAGGADLNIKDLWGKTPLQEASESGYTNVCDVILASGYPCDLVSALQLGRREIAKKLIREDPLLAKRVLLMGDLWGDVTPLGIAAIKGDEEMVVLLLHAGAPVNEGTMRPNLGKITPLCNAVWADHYKIAELLCNAGAECNLPGGKNYANLLDYAQKKSDGRMVKLLIAHGGTNAIPNSLLK